MMDNLKPVLIACAVVCSLWLGSCTSESSYRDLQKSELDTRHFMGFDIPVFPTARDQLNYARSGFPDPKEKRAALNFLFKAFPQSRAECGSAALGLAYINLEPDYRFALGLDHRKAVKEFKAVIKEFKNLPRVQVKAHWYIGWIYCDLLKEIETGLPYYRFVVEAYPDLEMGISPPVPWVSLVYSPAGNENRMTKSKEREHWASLSLLEIIRHTADAQEALDAFDTLWDRYRYSAATGLAIKLMLENRAYRDKALLHTEPYLALNVANPYLSGEIEERAKERLP